MFPLALYTLAEETLRACRRAHLRLGTVESCTGGMIGAALSEVPGCSDVFLGGIITYDNAIKVGLAQVPLALLAAHGAVSEEVARAMAEQGRAALGAGISVAVTGVAGPRGGSVEKPVGLVHLAVSGPNGTHHARHVFGGDRTAIRLLAVEAALRMVQSAL